MRDLTRRRHTASQRLMLQNPHTRRHGRRRVGDNTGRSDVAALKPTTPLQPLTRASMKPPSPLRAPEQQPLKPLAPLQPKNTPKTPISHPQRRCRFQPHTGTREQRRQGFQSDATRYEQRCHLFQPGNALRRIGKRTRSHTSTPGATGVEGAGGTCRRAGGRWRGLARQHTDTPTDWRPPRGLRGLAGLRADAPSAARGADGERAGRPRGGRKSVGATSNATDQAGIRHNTTRGRGPAGPRPGATTQTLRSTCVPCRSARAARRLRRSSRSPRLRQRAGPRR